MVCVCVWCTLNLAQFTLLCFTSMVLQFWPVLIYLKIYYCLWLQTYSRFCRVAALIVAGLKPRMHSRRIELPVKLNWDVLKQKPQNWVPRTEGESRCFILSKQNLLLRCCGSLLRRYLKVMKVVLQKCSKRNWLWCCWAFSTASSARRIFRKRLSSLLWLWFA